MELVRFDAARHALAEARSVDEVKDVRDRAEALRLYMKQAGHGLEMQNDVAEIKLRAERRAGELLEENVSPGNPQFRHDGGIGRIPEGISESQSSRWQREASVPEARFEQYVAETRGDGGELTSVGLLRIAAGAHVGHGTGESEWYTPIEYIVAAVEVMGDVDLDPASTPEANEVVGAATFYTAEDDGLLQPWTGRVWLNPPYAQPAVGEFCDKLAHEYHAGNVEQACALVNNATETNWFQTLAAIATALCFPRGRVKFWHPERESAPLQGQAVIYIGPNAETFRQEFHHFGFTVLA
jgi:phage N-6-adenine-methyltransferase